MRRKQGIIILQEIDSRDVRERFQDFEGIIIYASGPRALIAKEGYYDNNGNYKLSEKLSVRLVSDIIPAMDWIRKISLQYECRESWWYCFVWYCWLLQG